jgi:uncharacterized membrane protein
MKLLGRLFGSEKTIDKISSGIDKAVFTKEEKADEFRVLLKLYEPFKVAQRLLALIFCIPYALGWFTAFVGSFFTEIDSQLQLLSGDISIIVGIIIAFYFGGGAVEGVIKSKGKS